MSLFYLFVAFGGRKRGNRRTDRPSTVTLAANDDARKKWGKALTSNTISLIDAMLSIGKICSLHVFILPLLVCVL